MTVQSELEAAALFRQILEETDQPPFMVTSATKARALEWLRAHQPLEHADALTAMHRPRSTDERAVSTTLYPTSRRRLFAVPARPPVDTLALAAAEARDALDGGWQDASHQPTESELVDLFADGLDAATGEGRR